MGIEELTELEILQGSFTLTFVIISILLGLIILLKYLSIKKREFIWVGLTWIFLSSGWWGSSFSFLSIVLFNYRFGVFLYIFIANIFIPIAVLCWMNAVGILMYKEWKKRINIITLIICIPYEIALIVMLIIDPLLLGEIKQTFYYQPSLFPLIFQIFALLITISTGILFSVRSMKSNDPIVVWKARFLLIGFISFTGGAFIDATITMTPLLLIVIRLILIFSSLMYFLGFLLPDMISKFLISEK
ncbi:MAG: hypothetical protein ACTSU4_12425 [Promethearchaeota archaeon]